MNNAIIGFRIGESLKLVSVHSENVDTSPKSLGNMFALQMKKNLHALRNEETSINFFHNIMVEDKDNNNFFYYGRRLQENIEKLNVGDLSFIFSSVSRGRYKRVISSVVLPDHKDFFYPEITKDYRWAYIYNAETMAVEFYGYDFDFKENLKSILSIPYYASISLNTIQLVGGLQKYFDVIEFLKRNHEQEIILSTSLNVEKPHKHKEGRKKKTTRRLYI